MPKTPGITKEERRDMDRFDRDVLAGEYSSTSDTDLDKYELRYVLAPTPEKKTEKKKPAETFTGGHDEETMTGFDEGNNNCGSENVKPSTSAEVGDNANGFSFEFYPTPKDKQERTRGSGYSQPNLTTIEEEHPEEGACGGVDLRDEAPEDPEHSEDEGGEDTFPFPWAIADMLEEKCLMAKEMFRKYISEEEMRQIESVYSGLKTEVKVCSSAASLHLCGKKRVWMEQFYGVPVVVEEKDGAASKLWLYLAERGTGFALWREAIHWQSGYTRETSTYHVMNICSNSGVKMGLNFDCEAGATALWTHISRLTARLEASPSAPAPGRRPRPRPRRAKGKKDISPPCCFEHITRISPKDYERFLSLQFSFCESNDEQGENDSEHVDSE